MTAAHDSQIALCFPDRRGTSGLRLNHTFMVIERLPHFKRCSSALINKGAKIIPDVLLFIYVFICLCIYLSIYFTEGTTETDSGFVQQLQPE